MIKITSDVLWPTGSHWPTTEASEIALITAVAASSNGMPAAISAPNTSSSKISVIGSEVVSALRKSWLIVAFATRLTLASPISRIRNCGLAAWTEATALSAGTTAWESFFPVTLKVTSADLPSGEISDPLPGRSGEAI